MFQVYIDDEEVVCESNFEIKEEFMNPSSIELYKVYPKSWKGTNKLLENYYFPKDYTKCKILRNGELYFSGITKNSADMVINPFKPHYCSLQILDPTILLSEGTTLDYVISNKTVTEAISQVIKSIEAYGFVEGNILINEEENTIIGAYSTLDKAPYDIFNYLSMVSGSRWGTRMVDENTIAIDFFSPETLENLGNIETTKEYFSKNKICDINYSYSTTDYRNKQIMLSDKVYSNINQQEIKIFDGINSSLILDYPIGNIISIQVDGLNKTFATNNEKNKGINADFYYTFGENKIESAITYSYGSKMNIEYTPLVKGRQVVYNMDEINRISNQLNRNGVISRYENRSDVISANELEKVGKSYIKFKGVPEITLTIESRKDFLTLGGKYHFNAPIKKLYGNYLVKTKKTRTIQNPEVLVTVYEYELTNSFDTENELNYFDNQRAKSNGNIGEGETVNRNIDIESYTTIIFNNLQIKEVTTIGNNIIECALDAPFNN